MSSKQVEQVIWDEIRKRDITFYDMISLPGHGVCTDQNDIQTSRMNRFKAVIGCERMKELLGMNEYNQYADCQPLKVSFQSLFTFWWSRCIEQHLFLDEVLDDIYDYFTEQMRPLEKEKEEMNMTLDFNRLPLFTMNLEKAA